MAPLPIRFTELVQLTSLGIDPSAVTFNACVRLYYTLPYSIFYTTLSPLLQSAQLIGITSCSVFLGPIESSFLKHPTSWPLLTLASLSATPRGPLNRARNNKLTAIFCPDTRVRCLRLRTRKEKRSRSARSRHR